MFSDLSDKSGQESNYSVNKWVTIHVLWFSCILNFIAWEMQWKTSKIRRSWQYFQFHFKIGANDEYSEFQVNCEVKKTEIL
jgi:hypothetical protein